MSAPDNVIAYGVALHEAKHKILKIIDQLEAQGEDLANQYVKEGAVSNCDLDFARASLSRTRTTAYGLGTLHSKLAKLSVKLGNDPVTNSDFKTSRSR